MLAGISGTARRALAAQALETPDDPGLPSTDFLFAGDLSVKERDAWGRVHPNMMGGEYLPPSEEDEVEVVRIDLDSVTADVIQVRARRGPDGIHYRVVDEYETPFLPPLARTASPLSLAELIDLIDETRVEGESQVGLTDHYREMNFRHRTDSVELLDFVKVSSAFYPELARYYDDRATDWAQRAEVPQSAPPDGVMAKIPYGIGWVIGFVQGFLGRPEEAYGAGGDLLDSDSHDHAFPHRRRLDLQLFRARPLRSPFGTHRFRRRRLRSR